MQTTSFSFPATLLFLFSSFSGDGGLPPTTAVEPADSVYAGVIESNLIYQTEPYSSCHASTIVETGDGMLAAWFGGSFEKHPDVCIYGAFYKDRKWSKPFLLADGIENKLIRNPCWNPVLFRRDNGDIILYYKIGPSPSKWFGVYKISTDGGKIWSKEKRIPNNLLGPIKNKAVRAPDGGILYPSSIEDDSGWRIHIEHSSQDLSDWKKIEIDNGEFNAIQPSVLFYGNGRLQLLCRSKNKRIVESWSTDGGKSWSKVQATSLPNNNSGTDAVTLSDGETQLLIYNPITKGRNKLALASSIDGKIWKDLIILEDEEEGEFSYPAIIEGSDGKVYVTYTFNRKSIKYAILDIGKK
ncbi:MAG: exo-alpha-sialidase [Tannerellaceae bacterium]|jgi:alpha-L-fucosidase|nr:exo-alpha-sialidase [Tannerellaceae bacterium]